MSTFHQLSRRNNGNGVGSPPPSTLDCASTALPKQTTASGKAKMRARVDWGRTSPMGASIGPTGGLRSAWKTIIFAPDVTVFCDDRDENGRTRWRSKLTTPSPPTLRDSRRRSSRSRARIAFVAMLSARLRRGASRPRASARRGFRSRGGSGQVRRQSAARRIKPNRKSAATFIAQPSTRCRPQGGDAGPAKESQLRSRYLSRERRLRLDVLAR